MSKAYSRKIKPEISERMSPISVVDLDKLVNYLVALEKRVVALENNKNKKKKG